MADQSNLLISGSISIFRNPYSTREIRGIQASLLDIRGNLKVQSSSLMINTFTPADMGVVLTSSSPVVGATETKLNIQMTSWTMVPKFGLFVLSLPDYYKGSGTDYYFNKPITPCQVAINQDGNFFVETQLEECKFNVRQKAIEITYKTTDDLFANAGTVVAIQLSNFKNPITEHLNDGEEGFGLQLFAF